MSKKYKLIVDDFGKFKNSTFDFGDVTVFYGANEVGKTTIIDALSNGLIKLSKRQSLYTQVLEPRYGEIFSSKLKKNETGEEFKKIDHDLVRNLLIVRASHLSLEFAINNKDVSWVEDLKNKLFAGGVNPQSLIDVIERIETKDKTKSHLNPEIIKNKAEIEKKRDEISKIQNQIKEGESNLKEQKNLIKQEADLTRQLNLLLGDIKTRREKLDRDKIYIEKKKIFEISSKLNEKKKIFEQIAKYNFINEDEYKEIKQQESTITKLEIEIKEKKRQVDEKNLAKAKLNESLKGLESDFNKSLHLIGQATQIKQNVLALIQNKEEGKFQLNKTFLFAGTIIIFLGIFIFAQFEISIYFPILFVLAGIILLLFSYLKGSTTKATNHVLENIVQSFNTFYSDSPKCPNTTIPEVIDFLDKLVGRLSLSNQSYNNTVNQISSLEKEIEQLNTEISDKKALWEEENKKFNEKLPQGVKTSEEFYKLLTDKNQNIAKLNQIQNDIKLCVADYGFTTEEELVVFLPAKIIELSNVQSPKEMISLLEFNNLEKELKEKENEEKKINDQISEVVRQLGLKRNTFELKFGSLNSHQIELEKQVRLLEETNEKLSIQLDSFRELKKIILELSDDVSEKFAALSDNINFYLNIVLDQQRKITFSKLNNLEHIECTDFYGKTVNALQLSSGTKDAFVLSARLALIEKLELADNALLILDDPFVLMDSERQSRSLEAIKTFHERTKVPVLFFTKDSKLKDDLLDCFSEIHVSHLERN